MSNRVTVEIGGAGPFIVSAAMAKMFRRYAKTKGMFFKIIEGAELMKESARLSTSETG